MRMIPVLPKYEIMHHEKTLENVFWKTHGKDKSGNLYYSAFRWSILGVFLFTLSVSERVVFCLNAFQN